MQQSKGKRSVRFWQVWPMWVGPSSQPWMWEAQGNTAGSPRISWVLGSWLLFPHNPAFPCGVGSLGQAEVGSEGLEVKPKPPRGKKRLHCVHLLMLQTLTGKQAQEGPALGLACRSQAVQ